MKKIFIAAAFALLGTATYAQTTPSQITTQKAPMVAYKFDKTSHDFGKIQQGVPVYTTFTITNTKKTPIVIERASSSCGCTTPEYPQTPILKGKSAVIKVGYNAAAMGVFSKPVTVKLQGVTDPIILTISGEVITK